MEKKCKKCNCELPLTEFNKAIKYKDGLHYNCKSCMKEYRIINKDKIKISNAKRDKNKIKEYNKEYREKNKEKVKEMDKISGKKYREKNKEKIKQYRIEYNLKNKEIKMWRNLLRSVRRRLGKKKEGKTIDLLGYSATDLKNHLCNLFTEGMLWENHGEWHIDHIIPISMAKTEEDVINLCHYTNLQPLFWKDNLTKSNKILL